MAQIELCDLPKYKTKSFMNEFNIAGYPIPEFELVNDSKGITIMDSFYQEVSSKLSIQISHFIYSPDQLLNNLLMGNDNPRLFFKNEMRNNWMKSTQYGHPITVFTKDATNLNIDVKDQLVFKREHLIDVTHPYFPTLKEIYDEYPSNSWPWATLEMSIEEVRPGDQILDQIRLYEIDLKMRYYLEVKDITPFTAYQIKA